MPTNLKISFGDDIVSLNDIVEAKDASTDDLMSLFKIFSNLEYFCTINAWEWMSAPLLGINLKLFLIQRNLTFEYYVNCDYNGIGDPLKSMERNLPDINGNVRYFEVDRYQEINLKGKQLKVLDSIVLEDIDRKEFNLDAVIFQQSIDYFFGRKRTIDSIGKEIEFYR